MGGALSGISIATEPREEVIRIESWLTPLRRQKLHVFAPNRVFHNCLYISTEILGAASIAYTDGNVGQT